MSTKSISPTRNKGASSLSSIGDSFMYIEKVLKLSVKMFSVVLKEQILYKQLILHFITKDFLLEIGIHWKDYENKNCYPKDKGVQMIKLIKILITTLHQQRGV